MKPEHRAAARARAERVGVVVQARMSSRRLPGKVLTPIAGTPVLGHLLERLTQCATVDAVIVATSSDPSDDPVAAFCAERGVACHRGPLDDVAARFLEAAQAHRLGAVVRVSGDSPLLDPDLVDRAARMLVQTGADLVTNTRPRTHPHGQSVEAMTTDALRRALPLMTEPGDREHVTPALYRHADIFRVVAFPVERDWPDVHFAVDTPEDLAQIVAIVARMTRPAWDYSLDEIIALAEGIP